MNIDKYRMLLEAADTGSLSKAADKFGYTPSGMVHIVNSLEQEFSFPVLQRSNKGVSLTADGERIVPILRENDEMMYQFEHDYRFDSRKIERAFGLRATGYREGMQRTLASAT